MELRHIRYFLAIANANHFTRAAQELNVSQPALSQQIKQLEAEVGSPLFERAGRSVRLTAAGEILQASARRILHELDQTHTAIAELNALERGHLRVGAVQTVNAYLVPGIVSGFRDEHPDITITVEELTADEIEDSVLRSDLDFGISFAPPRADGLESDPLFREELVLVTSNEHPLANARTVRLRQLAGEPLVLLPPKYCTRRLIDHSFEAAGARLRVAVEMNSIEGILRTVHATRGATVLPESSATIFGDRALRTVRLSPPPRRSVGMIWLRNGHRSAAAAKFATRVREASRR